MADANTLTLTLSTGGDVVIKLRPDLAPGHVERITSLAKDGFYDGVVFHRVIPGFMAQGGDPTGTGTGGSDLPDLQAEFSSEPHVGPAMRRMEAAGAIPSTVKTLNYELRRSVAAPATERVFPARFPGLTLCEPEQFPVSQGQ